MTTPAHPLLDPGQIAPGRFRQLETDVAKLLETRLEVVMPQAEAVLPLEAAARGLGRAGVRALNLNTKPYGAAFGRWLSDAGATVIGLEAEGHDAISPEAVAGALAKEPGISVVSFVHAEAASGVRNDAAAIAALSREHGALTVIDLVASFGAEEVRLEDWAVDVAVVGPQKALAGPAGISIVAVSERAWQAMATNPSAPRGSMLSLLDWKQRWLETDKSAIPGTPSPLEIIALEAAVERVAAEGLAEVRLRHRAAAAASRAGARALGLRRLLVERARSRGEVALSAGIGELASSVVRLDHTGQRARLSVVLEALEALGGAITGSFEPHARVRDALAEAERAWAAVQLATAS